MAATSSPLTMTANGVLELAGRLEDLAERMHGDFSERVDADIADLGAAARLCRHAVKTGWVFTSVHIP